jgi:hypothetical protein
VKKTLNVLLTTYAGFERRGEDPAEALSRVRVVRADASQLKSEQLGLAQHSVGGIVTSPPYLCMSDYTLGQRLSYGWLFPEQMETDFCVEIGARRRRSRPQVAIESYGKAMEGFADSSGELIRPGGFVALVVGSPEASDFKGADVLKSLEEAFIGRGFRLVWHKWRPINWHRNHGYQRLKREKLVVFVKED